MEEFISGYCRKLHNSRTVIVEDGEPDCLYPDCPYTPDCPVAEKIRQALEEV